VPAICADPTVVSSTTAIVAYTSTTMATPTVTARGITRAESRTSSPRVAIRA
jgi:hypothetical protein